MVSSGGSLGLAGFLPRSGSIVTRGRVASDITLGRPRHFALPLRHGDELSPNSMAKVQTDITIGFSHPDRTIAKADNTRSIKQRCKYLTRIAIDDRAGDGGMSANESWKKTFNAHDYSSSINNVGNDGSFGSSFGSQSAPLLHDLPELGGRVSPPSRARRQRERTRGRGSSPHSGPDILTLDRARPLVSSKGSASRPVTTTSKTLTVTTPSQHSMAERSRTAPAIPSSHGSRRDSVSRSSGARSEESEPANKIPAHLCSPHRVPNITLRRWNDAECGFPITRFR